MCRIEYSEPPTTVEKQIDLLKDRGMLISDEESAKIFLMSINYYRFTGYALHFEIFKNGSKSHQFKRNTTFQQVQRLYEFDSKLRDLIFSYTEHIEVAIRTAICYFLSLKHNNSHWYLSNSLFKNLSYYKKFKELIKKRTSKSSEIFIQSYREKYNPKDYPAAWMITEILSFGEWSRLYSNLKRPEQKIIANYFSCSPKQLTSWMKTLNELRNICAHHNRLWNRTIKAIPKDPKIEINFVSDKTKFGGYFYPIRAILSKLVKYNAFLCEFRSLTSNCPDIPLDKMGISKDKLFFH